MLAYVLCVGKGDRVLALINIMCVCVGRGIYCLHQLILHVLLGTGQALIITMWL